MKSARDLLYAAGRGSDEDVRFVCACGFNAQTRAGLRSHELHKHPQFAFGHQKELTAFMRRAPAATPLGIHHGDPSWGRIQGAYPLETRLNFDEVGISFGLRTRKTYTTPEERAAKCIPRLGRRASRLATIGLTVHAGWPDGSFDRIAP